MSRLTFSIVINTYNRATSLVNTLESMFYLRHPAYEVIVVNGPSTDHTQALIEQYAENIKIGQCAETNLAKSRNIGIGMASGDIVCFIDDLSVFAMSEDRLLKPFILLVCFLLQNFPP